MPSGQVYEYVGVIHCHSKFSDGSDYPDEIAKIASDAKLDFLILTDHNTLRAKKYEGYYDNLLFIVGVELNDKNNQNHYLAIGIDKSINTRTSSKDYVRKVNELGGFGFIAHPDEQRNYSEKYPPFPWNNWECDEFTGIEIWNHMSEWLENLTDENKYYNVRHPRKSLKPPKDITLQRWDKLNLNRPIVGIAGADAHAHKVNVLGLFQVEIFPYKVMFTTLRNHIWCDKKIVKSKGNFEENKLLILNSLKEGKLFFANDYVGNSQNFKFYAQVKDQIIYSLATINLEDEPVLFIEVPDKSANINLIHNSNIIMQENKAKLNYTPREKGVYRVEVLKDNQKWIFSNPIRII